MTAIINFFKDIDNALNGQWWMLQVVLVILVTAIFHFIEARIAHRLKQKFDATPNMWDTAFLYAFRKPLALLIWVIGITFAAEVVGVKSHNQAIFDAIPAMRNILMIVIVVWFVVRFITKVEEGFLNHQKHKKHIDKTAIHAIAQIARVTAIISAVLIGLSIFGIPITGVVAFGGVGGLAIGFAAKDMLSNFFGGLMIVWDRPFSVGDWIRSPDKQIEGTVEHIGWRLTRIRTFDKRPLYVPNGIFSTISVENPSRMTNRRIKTNIGVRYDDATKIDAMIKDVKAMLQNHPEIDTNQTLIVNLVTFSPSSLDFMVYTFTKTTDWVWFQEIQQDVFLKIIEIITAHGAECAFPTQTVHVPEGIALAQTK